MAILRVRDAMNLIVKEPVVIREEASIYETVQLMIERPNTRSAFVVDDQGHLVGIVTLQDLVDYIFSHRYFEGGKKGQSAYDLIDEASALDLAKADPICVTPDEPLEEAVRKILTLQFQEIPVVDEEGTVIGDLNLLELLSIWLDGSQGKKKRARVSPIRLSHFISEDLITLRLKAKKKEAALEEMFGLMAKAPRMTNIEEFRKLVLDREILVSTGVGRGIAIPHGRSRCVHECVIGVGLSESGIDFKSLDGEPVHVIFMIAAPDSAGFSYARFLARVIDFLNRDRIQHRMLECQTPSQFMGIVREFDCVVDKEPLTA